MSSYKLVILESPNKKAKVAHYLGDGFKVEATAGHFRDLPDKDLGVALPSFDPTYVVDDDKKSLLSNLKKLARDASQVLLATDADREGEAISWHLAQELRIAKPMRLKYTEITEPALKQAVANITPLDQHLVDAQQARRILDRLIGYQVSPLLATYFGPRNSAGRVQSATLHLVVARELEREAFKVTPYWTLAATYANGLTARYASVGEDGKLADTRFPSEAEASAIAERARNPPHVVQSVETKPAESRPSAPFTTSTLQQAASTTLGMKPEVTMALAQKLFESGAISYHRTDSVALSDEAIQMARAFIGADFPEALPAQPVRYKVKADAQGAHEAIRPTSLEPQPQLTGDEAALYDLIRRRFIACQCKPAILSKTTVTITAADTTWRAIGSVVVFESFRRYLAERAEDDSKKTDEDAELPKVAQGETLAVTSIDVAAKKTSPPGRYTQASLIAAMEKSGIGRPSTYAPTVKLLFDRAYIAEEKKQLYPTPSGRRIDGALGAAFPEIIATDTTAAMETRLDEVAEGKRNWKNELRDWYGPFAQKLSAAPTLLAAEAAKYPELAAQLAAAQQNAPRATGIKCPRCNAGDLILRTRKEGSGTFLSCNSYKDAKHPGCGFSINGDAKPSATPCPHCGGPAWSTTDKAGKPTTRCVKPDCRGPVVEEPCPRCKGPMIQRDSAHGPFLSCAKYPKCEGSYNLAALAKAKADGAKCPKCGAWKVEKKSAKGTFLGCAAYPVCK
jgi:DNA topoisomerase-1